MTKKDYIRVIHDLARAHLSTPAPAFVRAFVRAFAQTEAGQNPRFDRARFEAAATLATGVPMDGDQ
jgi:hypothetical protein